MERKRKEEKEKKLLKIKEYRGYETLSHKEVTESVEVPIQLGLPIVFTKQEVLL